MDDARFPLILDAARRGEEWAARDLFEAFQPLILRFLCYQEPRAADDLAGEVWMAVAGGLAGFDGDRSGFAAWVFTIARRRVAEHRRRGIRRRTEPIDPGALLDLPCEEDDPSSTAIDRMSGQEAVELLATHLSTDQAEVLLLRVMVDLDTATVARLLGRSENWVRVTQHRAVARLAQRMGSELEPVA